MSELTEPISEHRVVVRACSSLAEFERCVDLQAMIWGYSERELVPLHVFVAAAHSGGQVLGAFAGDEQVGFVLAFAALRDQRPYLHSHMAAVLPRFQDRGIGRELKLKQREEALARGLDLIEWTFDPLELKNAHFNIVRLGAMVRRILPNQYGRTSSPLHAGIPTDRFVAEWWIRSDRVTQALAGRPWNGEPRVRVELPADLGRMKNTSPAAVEALQHRFREELSTWFARGYIITGLEQTSDTAAYLLQGGAEVTGVGLHEGTQ